MERGSGYAYREYVSYVLETCKSERDRLTVKFSDGATRGWQTEMDIFAALSAVDTIL